ncbi:Capsular polysaccharide biosynthesis protein [Saccharopolyspora antimicrobica]|uniref:Capsular polysaccharide biosynthesis protein n=1 Tax=Saccharopolyspora antimicrobica TaxID=455193 RepID=A0A1I4W2I8_9PSEU|nr:hypothetical protein [Saccharopolyspora antimicrobica]RKT87117.1 capsular polysaccharide biosynthesis protein [Saccharopolyspora antimicrobica]SFN07279.1 Capsular polysaccharide biosynthesis protein [Saccharopolyspora antimicrobica]
MTETQHSNNEQVNAPRLDAAQVRTGAASVRPLLGAQEDRRIPSPAPESRVWSELLANKGRLLGVSLLIVLLGAATAFIGALVWPPVYAARAQILFEIGEEKSTGFLREDRSLTTQLVLLRSRQVLGPVAAQERIPVEELEKAVTMSLLDSSEVLQVEARAGGPDVALRRTREIVDRYRDVARTNGESGVDDYVIGNLADVRAQLAEATAQASRERAVPGSPSLDAAEALVQGLQQREQQLQSQLDQLSITELARSEPKVVVPAYSVTDPVSPRPVFATAAGALTGLLVAAVTAVLLVRRWSTR